MSDNSKHILAIASGGGHWVQLLRLRQAFDGHDVAYVTVHRSYADQVDGSRFYAISDATRWSRWRLLLMVFQVLYVVLRERPDVVISTGAAPGFVALRIGKWIGARTIWVDSIANVDQMSMSGKRARNFADLCLSQWPKVAEAEGCDFKGAVL